MKNWLCLEIEKNKLENIKVIGYQPRHMMPSLISYSDIQFIFMSKQIDGFGFPSKVYTIMACERPLLVSSGENTPLVQFLEDKGCAIIVNEDDYIKNVNIISNSIRSINKIELDTMGKNGHMVVKQNYSKKRVTKLYIDLIDNLLK